MPWFNGVEVEEFDDGVGVDDYSRYRIKDAELTAVERYPRPFKHPVLAIRYQLNVLKWHRDMIRQNGWRDWNDLRKF